MAFKGETKFMGCTREEIGGRPTILPKMKNDLAEALMKKLDEAGFKYQARVRGFTTFIVNRDEKQQIRSIKRKLVAELKKAQNNEKLQEE